MQKFHSILCPFCRSHSTIKYGFKSGKQRYQCKHCKKKFCNSQIHTRFLLIYEFLLNKSLRNFENIKKDKLHNEILSLAKKLPNCVTLNKYLNIKFSGRIGLDALFVSVEGIGMAVLVAFDLDSFDIIDCNVYDSECESSWTSFINTLSNSLTNSYPIIFVSDGKKGIHNALRKIYPDVPRQVCVAHKLRRLQAVFPRGDLTSYERILKDQANKVLLAKTFDIFKREELILLEITKSSNLRSTNIKQSIIELRKAYKVRGIIRYQKMDFLTQFKCPELVKEDRTNNSLEGVVNSFLKTRIKLFRGFKSRECIHTWINLLVMYYRFHKFKASKYKWRNGRTPIETNWDLNLNKYTHT